MTEFSFWKGTNHLINPKLDRPAEEVTLKKI